MCHKFIFQSPALSLLGLRVAGPEPQCSRSKVSCHRDLCSMVLSLRVTGSRILGYWVLKFLVMGPRSWVLQSKDIILGYALKVLCSSTTKVFSDVFKNLKYRMK